MFIFFQRPAREGSDVYIVPKHYLGLNNTAGIIYSRIQVSDIVADCMVKAMSANQENHAIENLHGMDGTCSLPLLRHAEYKTYERKSSAANIEARAILKQMGEWAQAHPEGVWQCV